MIKVKLGKTTTAKTYMTSSTELRLWGNVIKLNLKGIVKGRKEIFYQVNS